ncbi:rCG61745, partial [Rattus norvegicus]
MMKLKNSRFTAGSSI